MSGLDDIRRRIASSYTPKQIIRSLLAMVCMGFVTALFPNDFRFIRDNAIFMVILGLLILFWLTVLSFVVRKKLNKATNAQRIKELVVFETRWYSFSMTFLALLFPFASNYYVNIGWFMSAFLLCYVLANPRITNLQSRLVIFSPLFGWILHTTVHGLLWSQPIHWPALLFCFVVVALLFYTRGYFIHHQLIFDLAPEDSQDDAVAKAQPELEQAFAGEFGLSPREQDVLRRVLRGRLTKEISADLKISDTTVKTHVKNIFNKTAVRSRLELFAAFNRFVHYRIEKAAPFLKE